MDFQGPAVGDLANVYALNLAFLDVLRTDDDDHARVRPAIDTLVANLVSLGTQQSDRLAQCPFLLFALAESEEWRWDRLFKQDGRRDMIDRLEGPSEVSAQLAPAAAASAALPASPFATCRAASSPCPGLSPRGSP